MSFEARTANLAPRIGRVRLVDHFGDGEAFDVLVDADDPDGRVSRYEWDLDEDGSFEVSGMEGNTSSGLGVGTHVIRVRVTDDDGATTTVRRAVVGTAPVRGISADRAWRFPSLPEARSDGDWASWTSAGRSSVRATDPDPAGDAYTYAWDLDTDLEFDDATGPEARVPDGWHFVGLAATGRSGDVRVGYDWMWVGAPKHCCQYKVVPPWQTIHLQRAPLRLSATVDRATGTVTTSCSRACRTPLVVATVHGREVARGVSALRTLGDELTITARGIDSGRVATLTLRP